MWVFFFHFISNFFSLSHFLSCTFSLSLQKRQILVTLVEITLPLLFAAILIVLRQKVSFTNYPNATYYDSFSLKWPPPLLPSNLQLAYVPANSSVVRQVAEDVQLSLKQGFISAGEATIEREQKIKQFDYSELWLSMTFLNYPYQL